MNINQTVESIQRSYRFIFLNNKYLHEKNEDFIIFFKSGQK
jgi:hypothetical protein